MDENTKKIIKERFDSLPENIQELIMSSNYENTLIDIGKKYQLNVEQMGILERETTLVIMGLSPTKDFEIELTRELSVDKIKGNQIVAEINEKIFLAIRDLLKLMYTPAGEKPSLEETSTKPKEQSEEKDLNNIKLESREELLKHIENPEPAKKIINEKLQMDQKELPAPLANENKPKETTSPSILSQKLSGSFQIPTVETEHSLSSMTKNPEEEKTKPKIDPYREIPG